MTRAEQAAENQEFVRKLVAGRGWTFTIEDQAFLLVLKALGSIRRRTERELHRLESARQNLLHELD